MTKVFFQTKFNEVKKTLRKMISSDVKAHVKQQDKNFL